MDGVFFCMEWAEISSKRFRVLRLAAGLCYSREREECLIASESGTETRWRYDSLAVQSQHKRRGHEGERQCSEASCTVVRSR